MGIDIAIRRDSFRDGTIAANERWTPDGARGLVIFVHDLGDHIGRHQAFVQHFIAKGYAVALYDQRGQGRSGGTRGHIDRFETWVEDLGDFVRRSSATVSPPLPFFLVAHGLGALIALNLVVRREVDEPAGIIALASLIEPVSSIPHWKRRCASRFLHLWPTLRIKRGIAAQLMTRSAAANDWQEDPLVVTSFSLRTFHEIERVVELAMPLAHRLQSPTLMLHGSEDAISSPEGTKQFFSRLPFANKRLKIYDGLRHELFQEPEREEIFCDIDRWLEEQLLRPTPQVSRGQGHHKETLWEQGNMRLPFLS